MSLPIVFRAEADEEFNEAFDWYETQRVGLGSAFAAEVKELLDRISTNPLMYPCIRADIHKAVVRRFPFAIFYRPHLDRVEVIAVFHGRRDPSIWRQRE